MKVNTASLEGYSMPVKANLLTHMAHMEVYVVGESQILDRSGSRLQQSLAYYVVY